MKIQGRNRATRTPKEVTMPAKQGSSPKLKRAGKKSRVVDPKEFKEVKRAKRKSAPSVSLASSDPSIGSMKNYDQQRWERQQAAVKNVNDRAVVIYDALDPLMVSSLPTANALLRVAMLAYVAAFTVEKQLSWPDRHKQALKAATTSIMDKRLLAYATKTLNGAFYSTAPKRAKTSANA